MCSVIADAKQTEQQSEKNFDLLKKAGDVKFLEFTALSAQVHALESIGAWPSFLSQVAPRFEAPPTPPPLA